MLSCLDMFPRSGSSDTMFLVLKKCFFFYLSLASWGIEGTGTYSNGKFCCSLLKQIICKQCCAEVCQHMMSCKV